MQKDRETWRKKNSHERWQQESRQTGGNRSARAEKRANGSGVRKIITLVYIEHLRKACKSEKLLCLGVGVK